MSRLSLELCGSYLPLHKAASTAFVCCLAPCLAAAPCKIFSGVSFHLHAFLPGVFTPPCQHMFASVLRLLSQVYTASTTHTHLLYTFTMQGMHALQHVCYVCISEAEHEACLLKECMHYHTLRCACTDMRYALTAMPHCAAVLQTWFKHNLLDRRPCKPCHGANICRLSASCRRGHVTLYPVTPRALQGLCQGWLAAHTSSYCTGCH